MTTLLSAAKSGGTVSSQLRRARVAVFLTFSVAGVYFAAWVPRIPEMKDRLGLSAASLGLALLAPAVGSLISMPVSGRVSARLGTGSATRLFGLFFIAVGWLPGFAQNYAELVALLFLWGIGMGGMDVAMNAQAVSVEKPYGRPLMSGFHAAWSLGSLVGAGIGTAGAGLGVAIVGQQFGVGVALLVLFLVISRRYVSDPSGEQQPDTETSDRAIGLLRRLLDVRLLLLGLAGMGAMLSEGSVGDWSGILLRDSFDAPAGQVGLGYAAFMATQTIGRLFGDRFVHRLGRVRAISIVTVIGAVGLAAGMATQSVFGSIIGFALLGVGLSIMVPVAFSSAADGKAQAGPSIALVSAMSYTGFLVGPTAIGFLADATSVETALWLIPFITAIGGFSAVAAMKRGARSKTSVEVS